jgi:hypothetical protein
LAYKKTNKKLTKGESQWTGEQIQVTDENGKVKNKMIYKDEDKKDFMNLVFGRWEYFADTKSLTKATFSMDIPMKAIKILSYKNDIIIQINNANGIEIHNMNARVSCFTFINTAIIYTALTNEATIRKIRRRPKGQPAGIKVFS